MTTLKKPASDFHPSYTFSYQKPSICPHCSLGTDALLKEKHVTILRSKNLLLSGVCECTACKKAFFFVSESKDGKDAEFIFQYPSFDFVPYTNQLLSQISDHFIDMYNQALRAEHNQNYELAAIGYRSALEILIKDYAIKELGKSTEEVSSKKLVKAIEEYLAAPDLVKTADVVRILGNDYTHYGRKHPEHDFQLLKEYMVIFLKQVEVLYMIKHPPVSRPQ